MLKLMSYMTVGALTALSITINSLAIFINVCICRNKLFKRNGVDYFLRRNFLQNIHTPQN